MKEKYACEKDYTDQPKDNVSYVTRIDTHILLAGNRRLGPLGIIAIGLLLGAAHTQADVVAISSIKDIINGTTIDFEQPGSNANDILPIFDMTAIPNVSISTAASLVTGNSDAPISNRVLFGTLRIQTTGKPWDQIGFTGIGSLIGESRTLTLRAFDMSNIELGSVTRVFAPVDSSIAAYNTAAVFLGLSSTTPIYAIELTSDNPNVASDNLRFSDVCDFSVNDILINTKQDPNILFANGIESTTVRARVNPVQQGAFLDFSTNFGTIQDGVSDIDGNVAVPYTAGILSLGGTDTTTATINVVACAVQQTVQEKVYNYRGFNFHQSNVSNPVFIDSTTMDKTDIQTFFESRGSFLARFILVGTIGGFLDTNNNGKLDSGEPTYSVDGKPIPVNSRGRTAATIFSNVSTDKGVNPQVLLTTAEKENSLISQSTIPIIREGIDVTNKVLNFAMGCGTSSYFADQIKCAAKTLVNRFNDTKLFGRVISYPFFFRATDGIRHAVSERCNVQPFLPGCKQAAFAVENAATFAQYRYTPFIQSLLNGGGVFLFEKVWQSFGF